MQCVTAVVPEWLGPTFFSEDVGAGAGGGEGRLEWNDHSCDVVLACAAASVLYGIAAWRGWYNLFCYIRRLEGGVNARQWLWRAEEGVLSQMYILMTAKQPV
jgi:hypothetical protein